MTDQSQSKHAVGSIVAAPFAPSGTVRKQSVVSFRNLLAATLVVVAGIIFWFLFASRSVQLVSIPSTDQVEVQTGLAVKLNDVYLMRPGSYTVTAQAEGYEALQTDIQVSKARTQRIELRLRPKPGLLEIISNPSDVTVRIDDGEAQTLKADAAPLRVSPGERRLTFSHPRYQSVTQTLTIAGREQKQQLSVVLPPGWADVAVRSEPAGIGILLDGEETGLKTPASVEAMAGEREIGLVGNGYRSHRQRIFAQAGRAITLPLVELTKADAQLAVSSDPSGAAVTINDEFVGTTPLRIERASGERLRVNILYPGYADQIKSLRLAPNAERQLTVRLERLAGTLAVTAQPADASLSINGATMGSANQTLTLPVESQQITISQPGYASFTTKIQPIPGIKQSLKVKLLTLEEARLAALKPTINVAGHRLKLFQGSTIQLGASRRQPGRRANETLRTAKFKRLFYLAEKEVSNAQFRAFASGQDSGSYRENSLNADEQPVAGISWHDAAAYCNYLSDLEGMDPFYTIEFGKVTATNPEALGYRLPTEAEWAWAARYTPDAEAETAALTFGWGKTLPPPDRFANFADRAAQALVGRVIFGYNDNYAVAAPTGTFAANQNGLFDINGNVAEWTNDFYGIPSSDTVTDGLGPATGDYHVIRGASWMHGTITELRLSFRDYGVDGREDVGFRIARYAE